MLGKSAFKAPVLAQPINLGYVPYISGLIMTAAALFLISANRTKTTTALFTVLSTMSVVVTGVLFFIILPTYDGLINLPLIHLAEQAADKTPEDGKIVMLGVSSRPSVNFYAHRRTINCSMNNLDILRKNFQDPNNQVGITTEYYLGKLQEAGISAERLLTDHGYVLFRLPTDTQ
jgi:hypothetical protein